MLKIANRLAAAMAAVWLSTGPVQASSSDDDRPVAVEDIVSLEAFGRAEVSPDGRWLVYEKRGAYDTAARFDLAWRSAWTIMDLWIVDLAAPAEEPRRLLPGEGLGLQRMAWSPSGEHLLITRLQGPSYEYGIVDPALGAVEWTGLAAEINTKGVEAEWISDEALLLMVRPDGSLPAAMRQDGGAQPRLTEAWRKTARGVEPSRTVVETRGGIETTEHPRPPRQLVRIDLADGRRQILIEGRLTDFAVSPDGQRVAVVQGDGAVPISRERVVLVESASRERLSLIDLASGQAVQPAPGLDVAPHLLRWSPDSKEVLVWARRDEAGWNQGGLIRASMEGSRVIDIGAFTTGTDAEVLWGVKADWLGGAPVILARGAKGGRLDWRLIMEGKAPRTLTAELDAAPARIANAGEGALYVFADGGYWSMTADGLRRLTPMETTLREATSFDPDRSRRQSGNEAPRREWTFALNAEGESLLVSADGGLRRISRGDGGGADIRPLTTSPEVSLVLLRKGLTETLRLRTGEGERDLDVVNVAMADVALTLPVPVAHLDVEGKATTSWLFLPPGAVPVRGLVVKVYPGAVDRLVWADPMVLTYGLRSQVLAGAGYAVLSPSMPMGTPATRGDLYARSVDLAVDAALAAHPDLPGDRMAVLGHSFGGYAALEIAARSTRYRAYVASSSFSDMFGLWGEFEPASRIQPEEGMKMRANQGAAETGQHGLGAPPWKAVSTYQAVSPYLVANRIRAPVLLLTADMDFVPTSQAERMFSTLHRIGGTSRLVTYWGENHHVWSPANIRDRYAQIFAWLDETLGAPDRLSARGPDDLPTAEPIPRTPPGR
ncbi:dipeptidyl aminopeptidase/acylaminoacyl peptidase [Brevundimonas bullata]|uniref:Dipeptidyl aminopeptidase/acylaminoacyl peptidase n=1 Tax=Brevundimonas bullata TaxID=13160 RepID=A0A7W7IRB0_9CAUL|nr:prolyl oligopeptidase family serine peptidase [Brevundimonas bullata]MBB4799061.1 dipeptidyl aminopeptidase/acylaminoacyl peptidase [Brevundimonas bullata]MBB6384244.1 dipeptidyl aminopeptidase/acylaminoacyl peptidase [Brevundimonas bullata]